MIEDRGTLLAMARAILGYGMASRVVAVLAALVLVAGCATGPETTADDSAMESTEEIAEVEDDNDPLELPNRFLFAFNLALDTVIFKPVAATYRFLLPEEVRDSIRNALRNLSAPVVFANDLFQQKWDRAETTAVRFALNSTIGLLGFLDVAEGMGYTYHDEDFGQTLGYYGVGEGAYLVLPILGPSSLRDGTGFIVDSLLDPWTYLADVYDVETEVTLGRAATRGIDERSRNIETLDDLKRDSIDFYARVRSLYRQRRENQINDGELGPTPVPGLADIEFELDPGEDQLGETD